MSMIITPGALRLGIDDTTDVGIELHCFARPIAGDTVSSKFGGAVAARRTVRIACRLSNTCPPANQAAAWSSKC